MFKAVVQDCTGVADGSGSLLLAFTGVMGNAVLAGIEVLGSAVSATPSAPTGLLATPADRQVSLLWTPVSGATTYKVYRSLTSGSGFLPVADSLPSANFVDTGVDNSTHYYYVVTACNPSHESAQSSEDDATPQVKVALYQIDCGGGAVPPFTADAYYSGSTTPNTTATAIDLTRAANPALMAVYKALRSPSTPHAALTYTIPGLANGASYTVRLHFVDYWVNVVGARTFDFQINGTPVLSSFDVFARVGADFAAVTQDVIGVADSLDRLVIDSALSPMPPSSQASRSSRQAKTPSS